MTNWPPNYCPTCENTTCNNHYHNKAAGTTGWRMTETLEGPGLIIGPGFDYEALIINNGDCMIIRAPFPSRESDECYPYPELLELVVPIEQIRKLIE